MRTGAISGGAGSDGWRHAPEDLVKLALTADRVNRLFLTEWHCRRSPALAEFDKLVARTHELSDWATGGSHEKPKERGDPGI